MADLPSLKKQLRGVMPILSAHLKAARLRHEAACTVLFSDGISVEHARKVCARLLSDLCSDVNEMPGRAEAQIDHWLEDNGDE